MQISGLFFCLVFSSSELCRQILAALNSFNSDVCFFSPTRQLSSVLFSFFFIMYGSGSASKQKKIGVIAALIREGNGNPLQYSCLENLMDRGAQKAAVHGVTESRTRLSDFTFTHWRRKWQRTPVFLPGESQRWGSLVGCCLWGHTESAMTEATQQQQANVHRFILTTVLQ